MPQPVLNRMDIEEAEEELHKLYAQDPERSMAAVFRQFLADPVKPMNESGGFRPSGLLVLLGLFGSLGLAVFISFSSLTQ